MSDLQSEDIAVVTEVYDGFVTVQIKRGGGCKSCSMRGFCFSDNTPVDIVVQSNLELHVGDKVQLNIAPKTRIISALLIFIFPLICFFGGIIVAKLFFSELISSLIGIICLCFSFIVLRVIDKKTASVFHVFIERKI